jgi:hypothetical protein
MKTVRFEFPLSETDIDTIRTWCETHQADYIPYIEDFFSIHPVKRLLEMLDDWIKFAEENDPNDEYSMWPWLNAAKSALQSETEEDDQIAFEHIAEMNAALGQIVPTSLDLSGYRWRDVVIDDCWFTKLLHSVRDGGAA